MTTALIATIPLLLGAFLYALPMRSDEASDRLRDTRPREVPREVFEQFREPRARGRRG